MEITNAKEAENVRLLLFVNFGISPCKAKEILKDIKERPDKIQEYTRLLRLSMENDYDTIKAKPIDEINKMTSERVKEWTNIIAPITTQEYVTMSNQWNIPIDAFIDRKITPALIKEMLDFFIVGQEDYKTMLALFFHMYRMGYNHSGISFPKSNLLVCGPSGSGKTYGMQVLSMLFHVPFIVIHCNSLVQEGIVGPNISNSFTSLLAKGWQPKEIMKAVVCFDEFDKLFDGNNKQSTGLYNHRIVNEMLNIIDDNGEVEFMTSYDKNNNDRLKLSTRKMMFVFTGVFNGLNRNLLNEKSTAKNRVRPVGFIIPENHEDEVQDFFLEDDSKAFLYYGVKPEILGRIRNFVYLDSLSVEHMENLFNLGLNSPFNDFEHYFNSNGIKTILTDEGKHILAKIASKRQLGVRGMKRLIQQVMLDDMFSLNVGEENTLVVDKQYIMDNLKNKGYGR